MTKQHLGNILLGLGLSAWVAYYGLKLLTPIQPVFGLFLTWHLLGVIPGALLRGSKLLRLVSRKSEPALPEVELKKSSR